MKKIIAITSAVIAASTYAQAQVDLLAGTDFAVPGVGTFSDLAGDGFQFGILTFQDGGNGNNPFPVTSFNAFDVNNGLTLISDNRIATVNDEFNLQNSGLNSDDLGFATGDGGFFEFSVDTSAYSAYTDYVFAFAAGQAQPGTSVVGVSYDIGNGFQDLGTFGLSADLLQGGEQVVVDTTGLGIVSEQITFRVDFTDIAVGTVFDNVQISGTATVVPEPSTYAAIAGALALGFVAYRRRK